MKKIKILALEGCTRCETLINQLNEAGVLHTVVHCNKNGAVCDEMERLTGTFTYPISVIVEKKPIEKNGFTVYKEISTIVYFANNYSSFTPTKKLADDRVAIQVLSLTDMYNILKQS